MEIRMDIRIPYIVSISRDCKSFDWTYQLTAPRYTHAGYVGVIIRVIP